MIEQNWAGNITYGAANIYRPNTLEQLQDTVRRSPKIRGLGSRHSFNTVADGEGELVSLDNLDQTISINRASNTVTVNAGITYGQLSLQLHQQGYALHNMASLPHISVVGACATATHGSGDANGNLATAVSALELVKADGELVTLSRETHGEQFNGMVVNLGALGLVAKITLDVQSAYAMQQEVYENMPVAELEANFDAITSSAYSVSLFTDWQQERVNQVWLKRRLIDDAPLPLASEFFGAALAPTHRHPLTRLSPAPCTPQMGDPGPWHERLPHFRIDHVPATGDELQTEYFVPRQYAIPAMRAMMQLQPHMAALLWTSEVRTIAADALWLSPGYGQPIIGLHFSWRRDWPAVQALLPRLEAALEPFEVRPHWGKLFTLPAERVQSCYTRLPDFRELLHTYDPQAKFANNFTDTYI